MGVAVAGVAEGMALADRAGLQQRDVLEILELTNLSCPLLLDKGKGKHRSTLEANRIRPEVLKLKNEKKNKIKKKKPSTITLDSLR